MKRFWVYPTLFSCSFLALVVARSPYIFQRFFLADDLRFIPGWFLDGFQMVEAGCLVFARFLKYSHELFNDIYIERLVFLVGLALAFSVFSTLVVGKVKLEELLLFAIITALVPAGIDQSIFVVGSYPTFGVSLLLIGGTFIAQSYRRGRHILLPVGYTFFALALLVHPAFLLAPLACFFLIPKLNIREVLINALLVAATYLV